MFEDQDLPVRFMTEREKAEHNVEMAWEALKAAERKLIEVNLSSICDLEPTEY